MPSIIAANGQPHTQIGSRNKDESRRIRQCSLAKIYGLIKLISDYRYPVMADKLVIIGWQFLGLYLFVNILWDTHLNNILCQLIWDLFATKVLTCCVWFRHRKDFLFNLLMSEEIKFKIIDKLMYKLWKLSSVDWDKWVGAFAAKGTAGKHGRKYGQKYGRN